MGVAAEIVENGLGRTERLFCIDDPVLLMGFDVAVDGRRVFLVDEPALTGLKTFREIPDSEPCWGTENSFRAAIQRL